MSDRIKSSEEITAEADELQKKLGLGFERKHAS